MLDLRLFLGDEMVGFMDEAKIWVKAGDGGDGCIAFRREKFVPKGGPAGGDGGNGGSILIEAKKNVKTLTEFAYHRHFKAEDGKPGSGAKCSGLDGKDKVISVPPGTLIFECVGEEERLLADLDKEGKSIVIDSGGRGGKGNARFATSINQAPRIATLGEKREERSLKLVLQLIADVGIVGLPNAGKSTFLGKVSRARPKVASYPFTTIIPSLGVVTLSGHRTFVAADIPGLIEGSSGGAGLGIQFLRHIERTKILLHLVDLSLPGAAQRYRVIRKELEAYSPVLVKKPEIVAANKRDISQGSEEIKELHTLSSQVYAVSALTGEGIQDLLEEIWKVLDKELSKESEDGCA